MLRCRSLGALRFIRTGVPKSAGGPMCEMCPQHARRLFEPSRRSFIFAASAIGLLLANGAVAKERKSPPKPQNVLSPDAALKRLKDGNERYVEGVAKRHDFRHEREALTGGQNPYAAILSCADSRIAPEYAFDSGRGDLFVCRVAGNFANDDTVASMEYAVAALSVQGRHDSLSSTWLIGEAGASSAPDQAALLALRRSRTGSNSDGSGRCV